MKLSILPTHRSFAFYVLVGLFAIVALYASLGTLLAADPTIGGPFIASLILGGPFIALLTPVLLITSHFDQAFAAKYNL
jgi:hypothetical protein